MLYFFPISSILGSSKRIGLPGLAKGWWEEPSGLRVPQITHEDVPTSDNQLRRKTKGVSDGTGAA